MLVSNVSNIVHGHVLDCRLKPLLKACRDIEPRLYFRWNPKKLWGRGAWELRIRPFKKTEIYQFDYEGVPIYKLEYKENDLECHIKDFEYLNYNILEWLRAHDTQRVHKYAEYIDYEGDRWVDLQEKKHKEDRNYMIKQDKKYMKHFQEEFLSGRIDMAKLFSSVTKA